MKENLPVLLLKKLFLLPYQEVRLELNVELSKKVVDLSESSYGNKLLVICPVDTLESSPSAADLPTIGVLAKIKSKIELPNGNYRVVIAGLNRVIVNQYRNYEVNKEILESTVKRIYIDNSNLAEETAILRTLKSVVRKYMKFNPTASNSVTNTIANMTDLDMLTDIITNYMPFDLKHKVAYMNEFDYLTRANNLIKDINVELEVLDIESKIEEEIRESFEKEQRDYILKQKITKLNEELGLSVDKQTEIEMFNQKLNELDIDLKIKNRLFREIRKYSYTSESNPDSSVIRNYLDTVIDLPWNKYSKDETDLKRIKRKLDKTHYSLDEAKMRILEFIAVKNNSENTNSPIICLVGPPGTGKTTLGISISESLNREFYKISVGGMSDATELNGHKRTYLGSSPGKIIQGIKKCGTANPVVLIDEVDKIVKDFKGDPAAVLLDILDPSQNNAFIDNYVEEPFDLSKVLFILTANEINAIPSALKDRLEIIEINSYTENEKVDIAKKYIIPKIIEEYNTKKVRMSDELILAIINDYTKESGVRELRRVLEKIFRYIIINELEIKTLNKELLITILGPKKYSLKREWKNYPGTINTLGVTPYGGTVITFEAIMLPGNGTLHLSGNIESSLEESANVALKFIISKSNAYGNYADKIASNDFNINALNYSIKKNGTSGGLALATSILSLLLDQTISDDIGFTGEITLHGDICKVGGIKEKIIGAYNNGFKTVFIPKENKNDLLSVPENIKNQLNIYTVSSYDEVYEILFKNN